MPKNRSTLIEHSNTLIEQSDHLAIETRMSKNEHNYGLDTEIKKNVVRIFWEE